MLTSSVNVIIQLLILHACRMLLLILFTHILHKIYTVTGLPLTTLLHLISSYTLDGSELNHPPEINIKIDRNRYI